MLTASEVASDLPWMAVWVRALDVPNGSRGVAAVAGVADTAVAIGPQMLKTTLAVASSGTAGFAVPAPMMKMWSVTGVPGETEADDGAVTACALQFWKLPRTKSLRVAVVEVEERLSATNDGKHSSPMAERAQVDASLVVLALEIGVVAALVGVRPRRTVPLVPLTMPQKGAVAAVVAQLAAVERCCSRRFAPEHAPATRFWAAFLQEVSQK